MSDTVQIVSAAGLGLALVALAVARRDPWAVRMAGLVAVIAAWIAASDRPSEVEHERAPRVVAVSTGDLPDSLRAAIGTVAGAELTAVVAPDFATGVAAGWARSEPGSDLVLVWTTS
ncbi:MAG: hypothetical protein KDB80_16940, partial [Planctomycetes bacterium]|nr:hypothetical protein [Planctomycetota bacterium]